MAERWRRPARAAARAVRATAPRVEASRPHGRRSRREGQLAPRRRQLGGGDGASTPLSSPPYNYLETLSNIKLVASRARLETRKRAPTPKKSPSTAFSTLRSSASPVEASDGEIHSQCAVSRAPQRQAKTSTASLAFLGSQAKRLGLENSLC